MTNYDVATTKIGATDLLKGYASEVRTMRRFCSLDLQSSRIARIVAAIFHGRGLLDEGAMTPLIRLSVHDSRILP